MSTVITNQYRWGAEEIAYSVAEENDVRYVFATAVPHPGGTQHTLAQAGVRFSQVLRTWLYLGDIVGTEGELVRYKELNRARTDFFDGLTFFTDQGSSRPLLGAVYPASTGIGTHGRDIVM